MITDIIKVIQIINLYHLDMTAILYLVYFYILYFVYYFVCGLRSDMPCLINK